MTRKLVIASVVIVAVWLFIMSRPEVSNRVKAWITAIITISPIPPFP